MTHNTQQRRLTLLNAFAIVFSVLVALLAVGFFAWMLYNGPPNLDSKTVSQQRILDRHLALDLSAARRLLQIQELSETNQEHIDALKADLATAQERIAVMEGILAQVSGQLESERKRINDRILSIEAECRQRGCMR